MNAFLQLRLLPRGADRAGEAARRLHGRRLRGQAHLPRAGARPARAPDLPPVRRQRQQDDMDWKRYLWATLWFNVVGFLAVYALQRLQDVLPLNPQKMGAVSRRLVLQHRGQLRHQHQLAGLRRRDDDELPHPDARPRRAELRLGRDRHGRAGRPDPRLRAQAGGRHRQLLGRPDAHHALHPAAAVAAARLRAGLAGRGADLPALQDGPSQPLRSSSRSRRRRQAD